MSERTQSAPSPLPERNHPGRRRRRVGPRESCARTECRQARKCARDDDRDAHLDGPAQADRCRRAEHRLRRGRTGAAARWSFCCMAGRTTFTASSRSRRCSPRRDIGCSSLPARLRHDTLPFQRDPAQRPAFGARARHGRLHGCPRDSHGTARRLRLGRAHGQHRCCALARALQGDGVRQRLSDRQPGGRQGFRCRRRPSCSGGISTISRPSAAALGYEKYRRDFAKLIWKIASPKWNFDDATFERSAAAFDNPDHVAIAIHNYRWRLGLAEGEARYDEFEKRLAAAPVITVPTITLEGDANGAPHADPGAYAMKFSGRYAHRTVTGGVGHNLPQEAPQDFAQAVIDVDKY